MKRLLLAVALLVTGVFIAEPAYRTAPLVGELPTHLVPQLRCEPGLGTGFIVDEHTIITAEHVSGSSGSCVIVENDNRSWRHSRVKSLRVEVAAPEHDYSRLTSRRPLTREETLEVACEPMEDGQAYHVMGYPLGSRHITTYTLIATGRYYTGRHPSGRLTRHLRFTYGNSHPGMSGGPVFDSQGRVIAFLQSRAIDGLDGVLVKEMADTEFCRSDK